MDDKPPPVAQVSGKVRDICSQRKVDGLKLERYSFFENLAQEKDCWLNSTEAALYLSLSVNALRISVCRGHIKAYKLGRRLRFRLSELMQVPKLSGNFLRNGNL